MSGVNCSCDSQHTELRNVNSAPQCAVRAGCTAQSPVTVVASMLVSPLMGQVRSPAFTPQPCSSISHRANAAWRSPYARAYSSGCTRTCFVQTEIHRTRTPGGQVMAMTLGISVAHKAIMIRGLVSCSDPAPYRPREACILFVHLFPSRCAYESALAALTPGRCPETTEGLNGAGWAGE